MPSFRSEQKSVINVIYCPEMLGDKTVEEFRELAKTWLLAPVSAHILDLQKTKTIDRSFYQALLFFRTALKGGDKGLCSIHVSDILMKQIKADGLDTSFSPVSDMDEAMKKIGQVQESKNKIDLEFLKPFLAATGNALSVQCLTEVTAQKPYIKKSPAENIAIASILSLASNGFHGTLTLCFSQNVFLSIYNKMFDENLLEISSESEDCAAEILNIIYGAAKIELNQKGYSFQKSLPTVITAQKLKVQQTSFGMTVVLPFETKDGVFYLEVEFGKS